MSSYLFKPKEIDILKKAIFIHKEIESEVKNLIVKDSSPKEINEFVFSQCKLKGVKPAFLGEKNYKNQEFPASCCVLVNSEIVHNIPYSDQPFKDGDLVKFDFGIKYGDFYTDFGFTQAVGTVSENHQKLVKVAKESVLNASKFAIHNGKSGDISSALQEVTLLYNFKPVLFFCGHGIGKSLHQDPQIPFWGDKSTGAVLEAGMVLCIENWICEKDNQISEDRDGWTFRLRDGGFSSFYESMVLVQKKVQINLTESI